MVTLKLFFLNLKKRKHSNKGYFVKYVYESERTDERNEVDINMNINISWIFPFGFIMLYASTNIFFTYYIILFFLI